MGVREILLDRATDKGRHKATIEIALEMKKDGFPIDKIVKLTKLSAKKVEAL